MKTKIKKLANVFYHQRFLTVGGCETFELEVIYKYARYGYEIDLFYKECLNNEYLRRIADVIGEDHIHKYNGEIIYCNTLFINYDMEGFIENVYADKVINIIHANFFLQTKFQLHDNPKITKRLAVSKEVARGYKKRFGLNCDVCYNPLTIKQRDRRRVLTFIAATRLTEEKGGKRIERLVQELERNKIPFYFHIFTNDVGKIGSRNVFYHEPTLDIRPYINNADYLVQLSDSEGYCYSVLEALTLGTPVIVTDLPVFKEMGVDNGHNGFILPLDMSQIPIDDIYGTKLKPLYYEPNEDNYRKYLYKGKTEIIEEELMRVKVIAPYHDLVAKVHYVEPRQMINNINFTDGEPNKPIGSVVDLTEQRAKVLVEKGLVEYIDKPKTIIDEIKALKPKPKAKRSVKKVK